VDLGFDSLGESEQKTYKFGIHSFPAISMENKPTNPLNMSLDKVPNEMPLRLSD